MSSCVPLRTRICAVKDSFPHPCPLYADSSMTRSSRTSCSTCSRCAGPRRSDENLPYALLLDGTGFFCRVSPSDPRATAQPRYAARQLAELLARLQQPASQPTASDQCEQCTQSE